MQTPKVNEQKNKSFTQVAVSGLALWIALAASCIDKLSATRGNILPHDGLQCNLYSLKQREDLYAYPGSSVITFNCMSGIYDQ